MADTIVSSKNKTVIIGPYRPFTIIGERINPTGRKLLAAEMAAGNFDRVISDALGELALQQLLWPSRVLMCSDVASFGFLSYTGLLLSNRWS